ncbi:ABC transporter permease [Bradyrhizobium sp. SBR1B]|uniref:ABC transporter permease n=1 Tax=Bradyrhizobium sp. SBR1B TaxID=2663836 RepID=UPI0016060DA0|nr:ABC transporter permease [Bradyrhizobium sp. SBR1B]MBB4383216.1 ribose/xylose/arabinose/galactoside ABC-type transport system permease subunit [Bradyrhizobium sp. SBR1B]
MLQAWQAGRGDGELARRIITISVFALACAAIGLAAPSFLTLSNLRAIELSSSVLLVASVGATFVILMGSIDLSVGAVASFCGMLVARMAPDLGVWSIPIGCLVGLSCGLINGLIYVHLRIPSILVTLATATTLSGAVLFISDGRSLTVSDAAVIEIAQGTWLRVIPNGVLISLVVYLAAVLVGARTRFGRMTLALGSDEQTATLVGVKVNTIKIQAFALSGGLGGLAGALLAARLGSATATMGGFMTLDTITAVVVGGTAITGGFGNVRLTILGVLFATTLSNGLNTLALAPHLQAIIQGIVILLAVLLNTKRVSAEDVR